MSNHPREIPPLWLEQLQLDELSPQRRAALCAEFGQAALEAATEEVRKQELALRKQLPRLRAQQRLWLTVPGRRSPFSRLNPLPLAALGLSLLVLWTLPSSPTPEAAPSSRVPAPLPSQYAETRIKGQEPQLLIFRQAAGAVQMLPDGATASAGDVLQIAYVGAGAPHGVVASVDGRGTVTVHFPVEGNDTALQSGKVLLDHAYQLDDAPNYEQFIFITGERPIDLDAIRSALKASAAHGPKKAGQPMQLPSFEPDQHVVTHLLLKQGAP